MSIDKALYQAPQGIEAALGEPDIEIEIEDPKSVNIKAGDMEIEIEPGKGGGGEEFTANLAEYIDEGTLATLAGDLLGDFEEDISSRKDWMQTYVDGLELLGMKLEDRAEPWEGACGVYHPLLAETLVKFQAETIMETFPASGPVKTQIIGKETPEKLEAAIRVRDDMNYQLTEVMKEYRPEQERLLWGLGLSGNAFKKVYYDPSLQRQSAVFVPAEDVVVPYGASNLETAERVTHVMRKTENEVRRLQVAGFYRDIDLPEPVNTLDDVEKKIAEKMGFRATSDDRYKLLEMQVYLDLEGYEDTDEDGALTGIALPYIVTLDKSSNEILAIRRNWEPDDETKQKRNHFVHYGYIPGFGFYHFGLIHLIGAYAKSGTSLMRQLVDAGTLANLPGGLKTKGMRTKGDDTPIAPGEWRDVDVASGTIRDNILPLPYKEPSQVLMTLMNQIVDEGRNFASAADLQVSDMSGNAPVGTTLAILERSLKVMSAVQARIHYAMKQEFKLLKNIIAEYTPEEYSYDPEEGDRMAKKSDYSNVDVIPVSDPNAATMAQKITQYQAVMQMAQGNPDIYDMTELNRQMLEILGVKNINKLLPSTEDKKPQDPVTENMAVLNNQPVKAFIFQDHEAHIAVHTMAIQDPKIMGIIGQNPNAQAIMAAGMAHIAEHVAFQYRRDIEEQLGVELPEQEEDMSEEMQNEIARLMALAAEKLSAKDNAEVQAKQAQAMAQDPIMQMQQQELQIKAQEMEIKKQKVLLDAAAKKDQLAIEKARIESQKEIAGMQIGAKIQKDKAELDTRQKIDGLRIGTDIARSRQQIEQQDKASERQAQSQRDQMMHQMLQQITQRNNPKKGS
jgi:hypothetical protein